jgi:hypothetical protein
VIYLQVNQFDKDRKFKTLYNMDMSLKPSKPVPYGGERDAAKITNWVFMLENCFKLHQMMHPENTMSDDMCILYATTLLRGAALTWWQSLTLSGQTPTTWIGFVEALKHEFYPPDAHRQARDRLSSLRQVRSVSAYNVEFQNVCLLLHTYITEDEKLDRFIRGLKPVIRLEVLKASPTDFQSAVRLAIAVDNAMFTSRSWGLNASSSSSHGSSFAGRSPMEIGNMFMDEDMEPAGRELNNVVRRGSSYERPFGRNERFQNKNHFKAQGGQEKRTAGPKQCFRCGSAEHFVANCPKPAPTRSFEMNRAGNDRNQKN